MKRKYATADLHNGLPTPSKGTEPAPVTANGFPPIASDDNGSRKPQSSQLSRSRSLMKQLRRDAFDGFKSDLCLELDNLRQPLESSSTESKTDSSDPTKDDCNLEMAASEGSTSEAPLEVEDAASEQGAPSEHSTSEGYARVRDVLQQWAEQDRVARYTNHLYYRLDHKYSETRASLQPRDLVVAEVLGQVAEDLHLEVFLAWLDADDRRPAPRFQVHSLNDLQGYWMAINIPIDPLNWVQASLPPLKGRASDRELAIMLVPRDSLVDFVMQYAEASDTSSTPFFHETSRVVWFVKCFIARISEQAIGEQFLPVLRELCARIWQLDQARGLALLPKSVVLSLLKAVTRAQDLKFLEQATSRLGGCPPLKFFEWIFQKVASGGLQLPAIEKSLLAIASIPTTLSCRMAIIYPLIDLQEPQRSGEKLPQKLIDSVSSDVSSYEACYHAGNFFVDLVYKTQGLEGLVSQLPRAVENNAAQISFVLGVLGGLHSLTEAQPHTPSIPCLIEQSAQCLVDALAIQDLFQRVPCQQSGVHICMCGNPRKPSSIGAVDAVELANTVAMLLANDAESVVACLTTKIVADVGLIPTRELTALWLPFLRHLIKVLETYGVLLSTPQYHDLFAAILETYISRYVGVRSFRWAPKYRKVNCLCNICGLFNRFLKSNVTAVSFGAAFQSNMVHIGSQLIRYADKGYRCHFSVEDGVLVARKENDDQTLQEWREKVEKANPEFRKLDGPALREILGEDYGRIRFFNLEQTMPGPSSPVPIESLEKSRRETRPFNAPQTPVSPSPKALGSGCALNNDVAGPLAPAATLASHPSASAGYDLFADRLGARLRTLSSFKTPESIEMAINRRWELMGAEERQHYITKAAKMLPPVDETEPPAALPFNPHGDRLPSPPKPSPHGASTASQSTTTHEPQNRASGRATCGSALSRPRTPVSTPAARVAAAETVATLRTASSSRTLAPVSLSRLNPVLESRRQKIKAEGSPQATPRVAKRNILEVIDLTEED